ncbi:MULTISPECIES: DUF294 nucleotidyltransferase-like domain-containing protein [unclassified Psychrobacter]|uniref:DUF294 nucleotidyltransferase-like domain-containing protein n=2 Tax=Psychrobacter TaxID=497 RepID=UPI003FD629ED
MPQLDFTQPPFDVLSADERLSVKKHTQVRYLAKDDSLAVDDLQYFFVVLKGQIEQRLGDEFVATYLGNNHTKHLNSNDWFDSRRTPERTDKNGEMGHSPEYYQFCAVEDSLLLQVDGSAIDKIGAQNYLVRQLLSDKLSERLKALELRRSNQAAGTNSYTAQQEVQQILLQPVTDVTLLPVHIVAASSSLYQATRIMMDAGLKHVLVRSSEHTKMRQSEVSHSVVPPKSDRTLGLLSDHDICRAVSDQKDPATTPCLDYASFNLHTIKDKSEIGDALLMMTRYRIHRLPVLNDSDTVIGVLAQSDLIAYVGQHSQLISMEIEHAQDMSSLDKAVELIGRYIRAQQQNGVKVSVVSRMVQQLNAQVFTKLWQLIAPKEVIENTCVIVMGSEGRGEQIMRTDQDNALIIRDGFTHPDLEKFADTFNQHLSVLGYPLCDGHIMMNNPIWRQSISDFKAQISLWFKNTDPMHGIYLSSILDGEYVCGDRELLVQIRAHLQVAHMRADPMFVRHFARAALQFGDVSQWWQKFVPLIGKPTRRDVDLKKSGLFPLVHGIRALALEHNIFEVTSTKERLKALVNAGMFNKERAETLGEALEFFMAQRLAVALATDDKYARQVDPITLSALERDALKECLAVVKSFKYELTQHYQLEIG